MNKLCKEYISDAKKFFPVMGKNERAYLRGIVSELEDCIERESVTTKKELYTKYRQPYDLANDYYSRLETEDIVKKIGLSRYIKAFIVFIILTVFVVSSVYLTVVIQSSIQHSREEMVGISNVLETMDESDIDIKSENYDALNQNDEDIIIEEEIIE